MAFLIGGAPTSADHGLSRRMVRAWADFATTGDPGWPSVDGSAAQAHTWTTDDDPADDRPTADRALWAEADFPVLRP